MSSIHFTHKGWFGICPVYIANLEQETPTLMVKHFTFIPLFHISLFMQRLCGRIYSTIDPWYEPLLVFKITGEANKVVEV